MPFGEDVDNVICCPNKSNVYIILDNFFFDKVIVYVNMFYTGMKDRIGVNQIVLILSQ